MELKPINRVKIFLILFSITYIFSQDGLFMSNNNIPYADAGPDIKIFSSDEIFLDATLSYSDDGSKLKYTWTFAPGLVLNKENDFSSEFFIETYDTKYLKSIKTGEEITRIKIAENDPGTKLEVFLEVKNSLGFAASDTLIINYLIQDDTLNIVDTDTSISSNSLLLMAEEKVDSLVTSENKIILNDEYKIPSNSLITRLSRYNNQWLQYAKYSLMAGGVYLLIDLIFFNNSKENNLEKPPGFPHGS